MRTKERVSDVSGGLEVKEKTALQAGARTMVWRKKTHREGGLNRVLQKMIHSLNIISRARSTKRWELDGGVAAVVTSTFPEFSATSC